MCALTLPCSHRLCSGLGTHPLAPHVRDLSSAHQGCGYWCLCPHQLVHGLSGDKSVQQHYEAFIVRGSLSMTLSVS